MMIWLPLESVIRDSYFYTHNVSSDVMTLDEMRATVQVVLFVLAAYPTLFTRGEIYLMKSAQGLLEDTISTGTDPNAYPIDCQVIGVKY